MNWSSTSHYELLDDMDQSGEQYTDIMVDESWVDDLSEGVVIHVQLGSSVISSEI